MGLPDRTLKVLPNPWCALDERGIPCGALMVDVAHRPAREYVGAELDKERTRHVESLEGYKGADDLRQPRQATAWKYLGIAADDRGLADKLLQSDPVELPVTPYYQKAVRRGDLFACDDDTARACGLNKADLEAAIAKASGKTTPAPVAPSSTDTPSDDAGAGKGSKKKGTK
jgi:hypothetical protein